MQRRTWSRRFALLACLLLLLAACGNGEETAEEPAEETTEADEDTPAADDEAAAEREDGVLRIGYILPETGPLAFLGPPQIESVNLAVEDINAAGGVLGADVEVLNADEAGDAAVAGQSAERLLNEGVDAIIGAASSGMTFAIIDQITGAEVVQCSGSNTAPDLSDYDDGGYYFRTAPPDTGQGPIMADRIVGDGNENVVIMARADDYGQGFADALQAALEEQGAAVSEVIVYDPEAASFDSEVQQATGASPDAIAVIGFDEGAQILQGLIEAGAGPGDVALYGGDGLASNNLAGLVNPDDAAVLEGMTVTAPGAEQDYNDRLGEITDNELTFGGQVYDCITAIALAAETAGSDDPTVFVDEMVNVVGGDGDQCADFEECLGLIQDGGDINYDGVSGPIDWGENGDPAVATYAIFTISAEGQLEQEDTQTIDLAEEGIDF